MAEHDNNKSIGSPELYEMIQEMKAEIKASDKENRERDEANHKELRNIMLGNGKVGFVGRLVRLETQIKIFFTLFMGICARLVYGWVT